MWLFLKRKDIQIVVISLKKWYDFFSSRNRDSNVTFPKPNKIQSVTISTKEGNDFFQSKKGDDGDALRLLLQNAPSACKGVNEQAKEMAFNLVLKVTINLQFFLQFLRSELKICYFLLKDINNSVNIKMFIKPYKFLSLFSIINLYGFIKKCF